MGSLSPKQTDSVRRAIQNIYYERKKPIKTKPKSLFDIIKTNGCSTSGTSFDFTDTEKSRDEVDGVYRGNHRQPQIKKGRSIFETQTLSATCSTGTLSGTCEQPTPKSKKQNLFDCLLSNLDYTPPPPPTNREKIMPKALLANAVIRKRLEVVADDFKLYNAHSEEVRQEACRIVLETNVDDLRYEYVLGIGKETQSFHQTIIDCIFDITNNTALTSTRNIISEIVKYLESIGGEKGGWFRKAKTVDFEEVQTKIRLLSKELVDSKTKALYELNKYISDIKKGIDKLKKDIEPYIVAVSFFSDYKKDNFPSELFISRLGSLSSTTQTLTVNKQQVEMLDTVVIGLLDTINNIILTELPLWSTSYLTMVLQKTQDATLETQRINLINNIKQKL